MSWVAVGAAAITAVKGIAGGAARESQGKVANIINDANAYASNLVRSANNTAKGARASLARYTQSVNNQRVMDNTASEAEAASVNYRRARDNAINDDLDNQIAFTEQAGSQAAAAALSGLTGGVADIVSGTTALRKSRMQQRAQASMRQADYDAGRRQAQIFEAGWDSLDMSDIAVDLDYGNDVAVKVDTSSNLLMDMLGGQSPQNMANLSQNGYSFFKGTPSNNGVTIPMQPGGGY